MRRSPLASVLATMIFATLAWAQQPGSNQSSADGQKTVVPGAPAAKGEATDPYIDPDEPLFSPGPLPKGTVSLIGATVEGVDRVRNRLKVKVIAGDKMSLAFDERTQIFRDGRQVTYDKIRKGDRVYLDTILNEGKVFARSIRIQSELGPADARGQITAYNPRTGNMTVQDELSAVPVTFRVNSTTSVKSATGPGRLLDLVPGALVTVQFLPGRESRGVAREVVIVAQPGARFLFAGTLTYLDLRKGTLAIANRSDGTTYDIGFDPASTPVMDSLKVGSEVKITTVFTGRGYRAQDIAVTQARAE